MKKIAVVFMVLMMLFSLAACGQEEKIEVQKLYSIEIPVTVSGYETQYKDIVVKVVICQHCHLGIDATVKNGFNSVAGQFKNAVKNRQFCEVELLNIESLVGSFYGDSTSIVYKL